MWNYQPKFLFNIFLRSINQTLCLTVGQFFQHQYKFSFVETVGGEISVKGLHVPQSELRKINMAEI